jgi:hypothetical protein
VDLRIGGNCFSSTAPKKNTKRKKRKATTNIVRGGGDDAGGKDYDDAAKVGAADRGNFRPGGRAHKDKAKFRSPFQL